MKRGRLKIEDTDAAGRSAETARGIEPPLDLLGAERPRSTAGVNLRWLCASALTGLTARG